MSAFPNLVVHMDRLAIESAAIEYRWTLTGTNTGPGGTGRSVRISGYEEWKFGVDGLIAESNAMLAFKFTKAQLNQIHRCLDTLARYVITLLIL
jgi:hypothetical protein